uniref:cyclin-dependent kinase n=1 Tax=Anopheles dirus TaxID=7168 RepID=A0A182NJH3_9DIPT
MTQSTSNYEELGVIGTGAYGTVYRARDLKNSGTIVALKKVRVALTEDGVPMSTLREIFMLKQLDTFGHPNVVKLLDVCQGQRLEREGQLVLFLVFEHLDQDLDEYIKRLPPKGMSPSTIQRLSREMLTGIDFLHSHRIVHRDLKPQNLLISTDGHLKLADFGLAKTYDFEMKLTTVVVTLWYRAPEVLLGEAYNSSVDIWSAGCIIAEMFQRQALFPGTAEGNQLEKIFELTGRPSEAQWPRGISIVRENFRSTKRREPREFCPKLCGNANDLLKLMLAYNRHERPSARQCLNHAYFTQEPMPT